MEEKPRFSARIKSILLFLAILLFSFPAGSRQPIELSYNWRVGQRLEYSMYVVGNVTDSASGRRDIRIEFDDKWEVIKAADDRGYFTVSEKAYNFRGEDFDLASFAVPPRDSGIERLIDRLGRVDAIQGVSYGARYRILPLMMPETPIAAQEKWVVNKDLDLPLLNEKVTGKLATVYTFVDVYPNYKMRGRDCARIKVEANYQYESPDGDKGVVGRFHGRLFFDLIERRVVDYEITEQRNEFVRSLGAQRTTNLQVTAISDN